MYAAAYKSLSIIYTYTQVIMTKWIYFLQQNPIRLNFMQIDFSGKKYIKGKIGIISVWKGTNYNRNGRNEEMK